MSSCSHGSGSEEEEGSMWSRAFTFGTNVKVKVEEEWGLGIGGTVWEGGVLLARYISSPAFPAAKFRGKRCIEIGAGITGLPSIAAAHYTALSQIVVTDTDECVAALADNMAPNLPESCSFRAVDGSTEARPGAQPGEPRSSEQGWDLPQSVLEVAAADFPLGPSLPRPEQLPEGSEAPPRQEGSAAHSRHCGLANGCATLGDGDGSALRQRGTDSSSLTAQAAALSLGGAVVEVRSLDWREDLQHFSPPFDLVLVADVVYIEELMEPLLQCMHALCTQDSTVLLAYYERSKAAAAAFWNLLPDFFTFEKVPEASYGAGSHPDHLGLFLLRRV